MPPSPVSPFYKDVPIIGEKKKLFFSVGNVTPVISMRCDCCDEKPMLTIAGFQGSTSCPKCRRVYFINTLSYDRETGKIGLNLGVDATMYEADKVAAGNGHLEGGPQ